MWVLTVKDMCSSSQTTVHDNSQHYLFYISVLYRVLQAMSLMTAIKQRKSVGKLLLCAVELQIISGCRVRVMCGLLLRVCSIHINRVMSISIREAMIAVYYRSRCQEEVLQTHSENAARLSSANKMLHHACIEN